MAERCNVCRSLIGTWKEDPLKTPKGLAGPQYVGKDPVRYYHIIEVRDRINDTETSLGMVPTEWREVLNETRPIRYYHIVECRNAIENILGCLGLPSAERAEILKQYFNYDEEGTHYGTVDREEWVDLDLDKTTPVRAFHIEDLRRPNILLGRWEQQSWTVKVGDAWVSWSISGIIDPAITQTHPIKIDASLTHDWIMRDILTHVSFDYPFAGDKWHCNVSGTAQNSGSSVALTSEISETTEIIADSNHAPSEFSYFGENTFTKEHIAVGSTSLLKSTSKVRFIWSAVCTPWFSETIYEPGGINWNFKSGFSQATITLVYRDTLGVGYQVLYGRNMIFLYAGGVELADGDTTRDAYVDFVAQYGFVPPTGTYLWRVYIRNYSYAAAGMHRAQFDTGSVTNTVDSEMVVNSIIYSTIGNVSL